MSWAGAMVVLCMLVLAPGAVAAPRLAATTVVEADTPAYVDVELDEPVYLFETGSTPFKIEGSGSIVTLSVRSLDRVGPAGRDNVEMARLGAPPSHTSAMSGTFSGDASLKPGRYRVYLQSDAPAKATLKLAELSGEVSLRASRPVRFEARPLSSFPTSEPFTTVLGAWGEQPRSGGIMHMHARFESALVPTMDRLETCHLEDEELEAQGGAAFQPGCSGSAGGDLEPLGQGSWSLHYGANNFPVGRHGLGVNFTHTGETVAASGVASWAGFADHEPPLDPAEPPPAADPPPPPHETPGPHPQAPAPPPSVHGRLSLASPQARVRRGKAKLRVRCSPEGPCHGAVALAGAKRRATIALPAGRTGTVRRPALTRAAAHAPAAQAGPRDRSSHLPRREQND